MSTDELHFLDLIFRYAELDDSLPQDVYDVFYVYCEELRKAEGFVYDRGSPWQLMSHAYLGHISSALLI